MRSSSRTRCLEAKGNEAPVRRGGRGASLDFEVARGLGASWGSWASPPWSGRSSDAQTRSSRESETRVLGSRSRSEIRTTEAGSGARSSSSDGLETLQRGLRLLRRGFGGLASDPGSECGTYGGSLDFLLEGVRGLVELLLLKEGDVTRPKGRTRYLLDHSSQRATVWSSRRPLRVGAIGPENRNPFEDHEWDLEGEVAFVCGTGLEPDPYRFGRVRLATRETSYRPPEVRRRSRFACSGVGRSTERSTRRPTRRRTGRLELLAEHLFGRRRTGDREGFPTRRG